MFDPVVDIVIIEMTIMVLVIAIALIIIFRKARARTMNEYDKPKILKKDRRGSMSRIPFARYAEHKSLPAVLFTIVLTAFLIGLWSLQSVKIYEIERADFFIERIVPIQYWIGISVIITSIFFMLPNVGKRSARLLILLSVILLTLSLRMIFPLISATFVLYEPDATNYFNVVNSWVTSGIDFGVEGNYQHDYPMAYLIAYAIVKLGIPLDFFFRFAPSFIHVVNILLAYLIFSEIAPGNKKCNTVAVLLFSLSTLKYWMTVHYCPNLVGGMFFLLSFYICYRFAKGGIWSVKTLLPLGATVFALVLSHHLSTLYFAVTLLGFSFSTWFFKTPAMKGKAIAFFVSGVYVYTLWWTYGHLVYPSFFNVYNYIAVQPQSPAIQIGEMTLLDQLTFLVHPAVIFALSGFSFFRTLRSGRATITQTKRWKLDVLLRARTDSLLVHSFGFVFVFVLLSLGLFARNLYPYRILDILLFGAYPISSQTLTKVFNPNPSRKRRVFMLLLLIFIALTSLHRYNREIQRRVIYAI